MIAIFGELPDADTLTARSIGLLRPGASHTVCVIRNRPSEVLSRFT
jgi:hypothetical protein